MDINQTVGSCVRRFRKNALTINQEEAASKCGLDVRVYGNLERGKNNFVSKTLEKVVNGLGMTLEDFRMDDTQ